MSHRERVNNMVTIKDFDMPSCCGNCAIFNWAVRVCHITYTRCKDPFDNKNDDCPLIEIESQERSKKE